MVVKLPPDLAEFVTQELVSGRYATEDELLCDAVRTLQQRRQTLRAMIAEGLSDPENDLILEDDAELDEFFKGLADELTPVSQP
jgi:putative addiction module CopG family antidote